MKDEALAPVRRISSDPILAGRISFQLLEKG